MEHAIDRESDRDHCRDPGGVRHQRLRGLLDRDPSEGPNQNEGVSAVPTRERHQQSERGGDDQHDHRPNLRSDSESVPIDEVKIIGHVGNGGHADPAEVDAEGNIHRPFFGVADRRPPDVQFQVTGDEQTEQREHDQHAQAEGIVVPAEQPGGVEETAQREEVTQPAQARTFLLRGQELVDREGDPADVDETPNGEDVSRRDEVDLKAIRDLACVLSVERQDAGENVDGERNDNGNGICKLAKRIF